MISSSPNSLDEVLNHVEQWSDIIVDMDTFIPSSPRQISKISHVIPSVNEYVDEQYISEQKTSTFNDQIHLVEAIQLFENEILTDENEHTELHELSDNQMEIQSVVTEQVENEKSVSTYLSNNMDYIIETIHVEDELFEATKTSMIDIQSSNKELSSLNQLENDSSIEEILSTDIVEKEFSMPIVHKTEESLEILSSKIVDYIDIPSSKTYSDDQKPEAIIVTTEESSSIYSSEYFPVSNVIDTTINEPSSIISLTIINEKLPGESLESLSVPVQTDLLPLATMPDQTTNTDEQRIPDRTVQDVLSASLEPTKINHIESSVEMMSIISFVSTEKVKDYDEFFDVESEYISISEKPPITLAEAEKLQHDAAIEQKDENYIESELDLPLTTISAIVEHSLTPLLRIATEKSDTENVLEEKLADKIEFDKKLKPVNKKKTILSRNSVEKNEEQTTVKQKLK